jgi:diaminopimelate decarboxylase
LVAALAERGPHGQLVVGGCRLTDLAGTWGTPLYVVAEDAVRAQVRRFRRETLTDLLSRDVSERP